MWVPSSRSDRRTYIHTLPSVPNIRRCTSYIVMHECGRLNSKPLGCQHQYRDTATAVPGTIHYCTVRTTDRRPLECETRDPLVLNRFFFAVLVWVQPCFEPRLYTEKNKNYRVLQFLHETVFFTQRHPAHPVSVRSDYQY